MLSNPLVTNQDFRGIRTSQQKKRSEDCRQDNRLGARGHPGIPVPSVETVASGKSFKFGDVRGKSGLRLFCFSCYLAGVGWFFRHVRQDGFSQIE